MNSTKYEHIEILDNGIVYYDSGLNKYTQEEVDEINRKFYENEDSYIPQILEAGYIEFPILWDNGPEPIWSNCYLPPEFIPSNFDGFEEKYGLRYNIYIPSYKRAGITMTDKMLDSFDIENYYLCIDPSQYPEYKKFHDRKHLIIRDPRFKSKEKVDLSCSVIAPDYLHGAAPVFNSLLYISRAVGEKSYFVMDDDMVSVGLKAMKDKYYEINKDAPYNKDHFYRCSSLSKEVGFDLKEYLAGFMQIWDKIRNRSMMSNEKYGLVFALPISWKTGTRSYSFYIKDSQSGIDFISNQNNDISTSLEYSKYGLVNVIEEGFCQYNSLDTQSQAGGATDTYMSFGTLDKSKVLAQAQPNYTKISYLYNRIHHTCDFNSYNKMRLVGAAKEDR